MNSAQRIRHQHERVMRGMQPVLNVLACLLLPVVYTLRKSWPDLLLACTLGIAAGSAAAVFGG